MYLYLCMCVPGIFLGAEVHMYERPQGLAKTEESSTKKNTSYM